MKILLAASILMLLACSRGADESEWTTNSAGQPDQQLSDTVAKAAITDSTERTILVSAVRSLRFEKAGEVGILEGDPSAMFGVISDAAVDNRGNFYVADARRLNIRMYRADMSLLQSFGRPGAGPGEFRYLESLDHDGDSLLFALDEALRRITILKTRDSMYTYRQIRLDILPRDLCVHGNRMFAGVHTDSFSIAELDMEGRIKARFGSVYPATEAPLGVLRETLQETMSVGLIACAHTVPTIVTIPVNRGVVSAYSLSGELRWRSRLGSYYQMRALFNNNGQMAYDGDPAAGGGQHTAVGLAIIEPGLVLVQLALLNDLHRDSNEAPVESRFLDLTTGQELLTLTHVPRIPSMRGDRFIGYANTPFPKAFSGYVRRQP